MDVQLIATILSGLILISTSCAHDLPNQTSPCVHIEQPDRLYNLDIPVNGEVIPAVKYHAAAKFECQDENDARVHIDVHKIGKRFHAVIQTCKNVTKVLLWLKSPTFFRSMAVQRPVTSCHRRQDTMLILQPKRRQVVTMVPAKHTNVDVLSLSWTYQYISRNGTIRWAYLDNLPDSRTTKSDVRGARGKRSNEVQVQEPVMKQHKPKCGQDLSCVRFGPSNCDHLECEYLLTYSITNLTFLELEISAKVTGWVALGLSSDDTMGGGDDVIMCKRKSVLGPQLEALTMSIKLPHTRPQPKPNNKLVLVGQQLKDGYIYCKITRKIDIKETGASSLDPTNNWYQFYARGEIDKNGGLLQHSQIPPISLRDITMLRPMYTQNNQYTQMRGAASSFQYCLFPTVSALVTLIIMLQ